MNEIVAFAELEKFIDTPVKYLLPGISRFYVHSVLGSTFFFRLCYCLLSYTLMRREVFYSVDEVLVYVGDRNSSFNLDYKQICSHMSAFSVGVSYFCRIFRRSGSSLFSSSHSRISTPPPTTPPIIQIRLGLSPLSHHPRSLFFLWYFLVRCYFSRARFDPSFFHAAGLQSSSLDPVPPPFFYPLLPV